MSEDTREHLQLFIDALRSNKFSQTEGQLRKDGGYCVWGVGCEVYRQATGHGCWTSNTAWPESFSFCEGEQHSRFGAPRTVVEWYGLSPAQEDDLMGYNDDGSISFTEIANIIEQEMMPS